MTLPAETARIEHDENHPCENARRRHRRQACRTRARRAERCGQRKPKARAHQRGRGIDRDGVTSRLCPARRRHAQQEDAECAGGKREAVIAQFVAAVSVDREAGGNDRAAEREKRQSFKTDRERERGERARRHGAPAHAIRPYGRSDHDKG